VLYAVAIPCVRLLVTLVSHAETVQGIEIWFTPEPLIIEELCQLGSQGAPVSCWSIDCMWSLDAVLSPAQSFNTQ